MDGLTKAERRKREKSPAPVAAPSSSSGTSSLETVASDERGMAVAACPDRSSTEDDKKKHGESAKMASQPPETTMQVPRQDARRHVAKDSRLDDISAPMVSDADVTVTKPDVKPGILLNAQLDADPKQFRKMTTSFKDDNKPPQEDHGEHVDTDNEDSPGDELRKKTVRRKDKVRASGSDHSAESWGGNTTTSRQGFPE